MPVTIKTGNIKYKSSSTGNYVSINAVAEKTTDELVAAVNSKGVEKVNQINARATEIQASYPDVGELRNMLAGVFDATKAYTAGQYVIKEVSNVDKLYKFKVDHAANTAWDSSEVSEVKLANDVSDLKSALTYKGTLTFTPGIIQSNGKVASPTEEGQQVYTNKIYCPSKLNVTLSFGSAQTLWLAVAEYKSDGTSNGRTVVISSSSAQSKSGSAVMKTDTAFIRLTFATMGLEYQLDTDILLDPDKMITYTDTSVAAEEAARIADVETLRIAKKAWYLHGIAVDIDSTEKEIVITTSGSSAYRLIYTDYNYINVTDGTTIDTSDLSNGSYALSYNTTSQGFTIKLIANLAKDDVVLFIGFFTSGKMESHNIVYAFCNDVTLNGEKIGLNRDITDVFKNINQMSNEINGVISDVGSTITQNYIWDGNAKDFSYNGKAGIKYYFKINSLGNENTSHRIVYLMKQDGTYFTACSGMVIGQEYSYTPSGDFVAIRYYLKYSSTPIDNEVSVSYGVKSVSDTTPLNAKVNRLIDIVGDGTVPVLSVAAKYYNYPNIVNRFHSNSMTGNPNGGKFYIEGTNGETLLDYSNIGEILPVRFTATDGAGKLQNSVSVITQNLTAHQTTAKVLWIGDSLSNRGFVAQFKATGDLVGDSITMVGTMTNKNTPGEGREGWSVGTFTGYSNYYNANTVTIQTAKASGSVSKNPFIRYATSSDFTNSPEKCYVYDENNPSTTNQTYEENPSAGAYVIFDFANYLQLQEVTTPDCVIISLGTNDIMKYGNNANAEIGTGLNIMIASIQAAGVSNIVLCSLPVCKDFDRFQKNLTASRYIEDYCDTNNLLFAPCNEFMSRFGLYATDDNIHFEQTTNIAYKDYSRAAYTAFKSIL